MLQCQINCPIKISAFAGMTKDATFARGSNNRKNYWRSFKNLHNDMNGNRATHSRESGNPERKADCAASSSGILLSITPRLVFRKAQRGREGKVPRIREHSRPSEGKIRAS